MIVGNSHDPEALETEVHVWSCSPDDIIDEEKIKFCRSLLSVEELEKYHRFISDKDKHSYLVTHALLRSALSSYVDIAAPSWQFIVGENGKPELVLIENQPAFTFNITHTNKLSACAISVKRSVGVDAEYVKRQSNLEAIARRMFAEKELLHLQASKNKQQDFYYLWTLREAYVKALGTGLSGSAEQFYFDIKFDEKSDKKNAVVKVIENNETHDVIVGWQFNIYQPESEHVISLAYESPQPLAVKLFDFLPFS